MLIWKREGGYSRDLRLANPEAFDKEKYTRLLYDFETSAGSVNHRLLASLKELGTDPENAVLTCRSGSFRAGYLGLNRWCVTRGTKFQKGVWAACALWTFLFGEHTPTRLAEAPPGGSGDPVLNIRVWEEWYKHISRNT